jgi:hypothetical protein
MATTADLNTGILFSKSSSLQPAVLVFFGTLAYLLLRVPNPEFFLESNDQGYQMALGMAVATGSYPGFDFISQYGPFVAFASWLAFVLSGNVIGEIVLCAAGYAAVVALVYRYLSRHANVVIGFGGALALLILFSRYYKWYYWLLPIATLVLSDTFIARRSSDGPPWRMLAGWGALVGVAGLFRYDLLIEGSVFGAIVIAAVELTPFERLRANFALAAKEATVFILSAIAPPAAYCIAIWAVRGGHQLALVLYSVVDGAVDTVDYYAVAPFRLGVTGPLALLQILIPLLYLGTLAFTTTRLVGKKLPAWKRAEAFPLFCSALMGLGMFPQALHRADLPHLLQVIPPFVITMGLLIPTIFGTEIAGAKKALAITGFGLLVVLAATLAPRASQDLGSPFRNVVRLWPFLAQLPDSERQHPVADIAAAIRQLTPPHSTVFVVTPETLMPMLFFAHRHQPGLFPTYEVGMFSGPRWLAENAARLEKTPPDYLVLEKTLDGRVLSLPAPYVPDLLFHWRDTYRTIVYQNEFFLLLKKTG